MEIDLHTIGCSIHDFSGSVDTKPPKEVPTEKTRLFILYRPFILYMRSSWERDRTRFRNDEKH